MSQTLEVFHKLSTIQKMPVLATLFFAVPLAYNFTFIYSIYMAQIKSKIANKWGYKVRINASFAIFVRL